jgi:hypothetical protein
MRDDKIPPILEVIQLGKLAIDGRLETVLPRIMTDLNLIQVNFHDFSFSRNFPDFIVKKTDSGFHHGQPSTG